MTQIELLAPAKDLDCGINAIKSGADAVYIGASSFGARKAAGNTLDDIKELILFAHKYYAKVYITINTILNDEDLINAKKLIEQLYEINADGIIIQDTGLLELDLPAIPIIASTQMHNASKEKVQFLEKVGIKRVILARELSLAEIKEISENTTIELEAFIHGALCVSYSGQCYMSYAIGGRSGNKGQCAQPCRKKFTLQDSTGKIIADDRYLLSLKDMNRANHIEEMIKAGISSFKIEGRLKGSDYIKNVVSYYRKEIDKVLNKLGLEKTSSGKSYINFTPDLNKTFNRDYTTYFLKERSKEIASANTPKAIGEYIGEITEITGKSIQIKTTAKLNNGDGICFFNHNNDLCGTIINQANKNFIVPENINHLQKGTKIYRNNDVGFQKTLKNAKIDRFIDVELTISNKDEVIILTATDENGITASEEILSTGEIAQNRDLLISNIEKQLSKLNNTEFKALKININLNTYYFIPVKDLNELRRKTITKLMSLRLANYKQEEGSIIKNNVPFPVQELDYSANIYNTQAQEFYKRHNVSKFELAAETLKDMTGKKVMTTKHCLKFQYDLCFKQKKTQVIKEPLYLVDEENKFYELKFDCNKCIMEIYS